MSDLLDRIMLEVLVQMSVISEQKAMVYDKDRVTGGDKNGGMPHLDAKPLVDYYRERFNAAQAYSSRRAVVLEAHRALKLARRMELPPGQPPTIDNPMWKVWIAQSKLDNGELARLFNVSRQYIHRVRDDYGG